MKRIKWKRNGFALMAVALATMLAVALVGCGGAQQGGDQAAQAQGKTFVYGTTGYGPQMDDVGLNPHSAYSGWSAVRYGVGETLFRFNDAMEAEPWLATEYEFVDDTHVKITLRDGVKFSSGRTMDGQAVKECLDDLIATHDRAPSDMKISNIEAEGNTITIQTSEPCPALINYLCDPYGAIIDMQAGVTADNNVSGTGPYVAQTVTDTEITLHKNENYWGGTPKVDTVVVRSFSDTDALQSALQSGEVNATYGLAYSSYQLFQNESYHISDCPTSRVFFGQHNYASAVMKDEAVRKVIAMGIDKEGFVKTLLNGCGEPAKGPFPANLKFGDSTVTTEGYDPKAAAKLLEDAGWVDTDADGIREKDGQKLTIRWLTYPGRLELPLLAEAAQANLKEIGMDVQVNSTANHTDIRKDKSAWDVYVSALTTAPTGDPEYFFGATCLSDSAKNFGGYTSAKLDELYHKLHTAFDADERAKIASQMSQTILDDHGYVFASFLQMGIVSQANVQGMVAHPSDYYEITVDLDV
ncbi:MAG: ABC transporter substrate-binding protein [Coriobacteriales bacterium]|nr:ABC transporter substrate-binding protein [Coriobacteriales bacterium]